MKTATHRENAQKAREPRERRLFDALRADGAEEVRRDALERALAACGLRADDPRLAPSRAVLDDLPAGTPLDFATFRRVVAPSMLLIEKALQGRLVIPDFEAMHERLRELFERTAQNRGGAVAEYIPQLARVDPEQFAVGVCTIDGQRSALGDASTAFSLQSTSKPVLYALALEEHGEEAVHARVGCEPSGSSFNELTLDRNGLPHNPMINAGAIMSASLVKRDLSAADRFDHVVRKWTDLAGGARPGFSNATFLSERGTADRNFALGYFMREKGGFPDGTDLLGTLEFFFQCCAIEFDAASLAVVAGTLANGGICPTTGRRVLAPDVVQRCLSLMYSCGMYDYSGQWAFSVGLPAKSGVSGAILVVVPNVMGVCVWSPRLDENGNSVRGVAFCRELVRSYNFHNYDNLIGVLHGKHDPRLPADALRQEGVADLCWAASQGDLAGLRRLAARGVDLDDADYDGRTALHLAASEGHAAVVSFLLARGVRRAPRDRWGATPLDDAVREGHEPVARLLGADGERRSRGERPRATARA